MEERKFLVAKTKRGIMDVKVGDKVLVFDPKLWNYKDVGDNSQFYKEAAVLSVEPSGPRQCAEVRFDYDGRTSKGHFTYAMKLVK